MNVQELDELFEYDQWATGRVLDAAEQVGDEFGGRRGHGVGSVRELLTHQGDAMLRWLDRLQGLEPRSYDADRFASPAEVRQHCAEANRAVRDWLAQAGEGGLKEVLMYTSAISGKEASVRKDHLMLQLVTHGVHHRAEAAELLTAAGAPPAALDLIQFYQR